MSRREIVPPGFKFMPEDHEIIIYYLRRKINGLPLPWDGIQEFDIYGKRGPWELVRSKEQPTAYVFALSKNRTTTRKTRTCSFGTWKYQTSIPILHQGLEIGTKTPLTFIPNVGLNLSPGSWHMNEFCLPDCKDREVTVICRVSFRESPKDKAKNTAALIRGGSSRMTKAVRINSIPSDAPKNPQIKLEDHALYCNSNSMNFSAPFSAAGTVKPESVPYSSSKGNLASSTSLNMSCKTELRDCNAGDSSSAGLNSNNHVVGVAGAPYWCINSVLLTTSAAPNCNPFAGSFLYQ